MHEQIDGDFTPAAKRSSMNFYRRLSVPTVINAAGPVTRYGGSCLSDGVLAAMAEATRSYIRLDELQLAAGRELARWTGTEAGYVTTGAAAGLTLGTAAIMAGRDIERMERLPDTTGMPNEMILQQDHLGDYDHAIRAAGARLIPVRCPQGATLRDVRKIIEAARTSRTCGTAYVFRTSDRGVPLQTWVAAARQLDLPTLVDASVRLPPVENLRRIPESGADLVAFSGGKAVGGPQGSGFVVGREDLIESILLQNQDMDVNPGTWFLREWIEQGKLPKPSRNGIGRGMKVSKETIVGLLVALEEYLARDHAQDRAVWQKRIQRIVEGLTHLRQCHTEIIFDLAAPFPVPVARFELTDDAKISLEQFVNRCARRDPPVLFEEGPLDRGYLIILPNCLSDSDVEILIREVCAVLNGC